jgi:hypothetical protein
MNEPHAPAEGFRALAAACDALGIDRRDRYGEDGPVVRLEAAERSAGRLT